MATIWGGSKNNTISFFTSDAELPRLIPLSQVHRLMTDRPHLRCAHRPDEIRWLSCDGVAVA